MLRRGWAMDAQGMNCFPLPVRVRKTLIAQVIIQLGLHGCLEFYQLGMEQGFPLENGAEYAKAWWMGLPWWRGG